MLHWQKGESFSSSASDLTKFQAGGGHAITMIGKLAMGLPLYRYSSINSQPGGLQVTDERRNFTIGTVTTNEGVTLSLSSEAAALLANIRQEAKRRGIRAVYVLPWAYAGEQPAKIQRQGNSHFLDQVAAIIPVVREAGLGVHTERQDFTDSGRHLTYQAAKNRSVQFLLLLQQFNKEPEVP